MALLIRVFISQDANFRKSFLKLKKFLREGKKIPLEPYILAPSGILLSYRIPKGKRLACKVTLKRLI